MACSSTALETSPGASPNLPSRYLCRLPRRMGLSPLSAGNSSLGPLSGCFLLYHILVFLVPHKPRGEFAIFCLCAKLRILRAFWFECIFALSPPENRGALLYEGLCPFDMILCFCANCKSLSMPLHILRKRHIDSSSDSFDCKSDRDRRFTGNPIGQFQGRIH